MNPELAVGLAGVVFVPLFVAGLKVIRKVHNHELILPELRDGLHRVESKVDTLTNVLLEGAIGERTRKGRG